MKSHNVFGMYSSGNLPVLSNVTPCLGQVRNVGGATGLKGNHLWVVH
jgi:hypothetical protein